MSWMMEISRRLLERVQVTLCRMGRPAAIYPCLLRQSPPSPTRGLLLGSSAEASCNLVVSSAIQLLYNRHKYPNSESGAPRALVFGQYCSIQ